MADPQTTLHYAANGSVVGGVYAPGAAGFNLADVGSAAQADALPNGVLGLVWLGATSGVTASFKAAVNAAIGDGKVWGFYIADEPGANISAANLMAEADYIHSVDPGAKTFMVLQNNGSPNNPSFSFTPANTHIDLFGIDPYPVRPQFTGGVDYSVIGDAVAAAEAAGIPQSQLVPVYQAFGATSGAYASWGVPTAAQEQKILSTWGQYLPHPVFDYAYSWGAQSGDTAISNDPALQAVFAAHNAGAGATPPSPSPAPAPDVLTPHALTIAAIAGQSFSGTVATFTDSNTSITASGLIATIDWGDGTVTTSGVVSGSSGSFAVSAAHTYAQAGTDAVVVTLSEKAQGSASATADSTATVSAPPPAPPPNVLTPQGTSISTTAGQPFAGTVATFTDSSTSVDANGLTATINWGDGTGTTNGVISGSGGVFTVTGSHTYAQPGADMVSVTLSEISPNSVSATAQTKATVGAPQIGSPPPSTAELTVHGRRGAVAQVQVLTSGSSTTTLPHGGLVRQAVTAAGVDDLEFSRIRSETLRFGSADENLYFSNSHALSVLGGAGDDTVVATEGLNSFTAGAGVLDVTGGSGNSSFHFHAGDGRMVVEDFSSARDLLTADSSLRSGMSIGSDGHGGTMITLGGAGHGIDLVGISTFTAASIRFT